MSDISNENEETVELNLYVELASSRIFEGKLFETFVILRPILPHLRKSTKKVNLIDFGREFTDFEGNRDEIRMFLRGNYEYSDKVISINGMLN